MQELQAILNVLALFNTILVSTEINWYFQQKVNIQV